MSDIKRFNNILGEEYELFRSVVYYYDALEDKIAERVSAFVDRENMTLLEIGIGSGITTNAVLEKVKRKF